MTDESKPECKCPIDPTAFGLFFVALISLPIALFCFDGSATAADAEYLNGLLILASIMIIVAALAAYRARSNFGFIVFGLVGIGVLYAGMYGGGFYENISLGIIFIISLIWSFRLGNPKLLTFILLTTAMIFIFGGIAVQTGDDIWVTLKGVAALANFLLSLYLAFALADEKLPCV